MCSSPNNNPKNINILFAKENKYADIPFLSIKTFVKLTWNIKFETNTDFFEFYVL